MATSKPNINVAWAQTGNVIAPNDVRITGGWQLEKPPYQTANFVENRQDTFLKHVNEMGIPVWDAITSYSLNSLTAGTDGNIYQSLSSTNVNNNPITSPTQWIQFAHYPVGFQAYLSANQPLPAGVNTKVAANTIAFQFGGLFYDTTNYRYKPLIPGIYQIISQFQMSPVITGTNMSIGIYKNSAANAILGSTSGVSPGSGDCIITSGFRQMNGTTDYIEMFAACGSTSAVLSDASVSYFSAFKIA